MKILSAHTPAFNDNGGIDLFVTFEELGVEIPYSASPTDVEPHSIELYTRALDGEFGKVLPMDTDLVFEKSVFLKRQSIEQEYKENSSAHVVALGRTWQADTNSRQELHNKILAHQWGAVLPEFWRDLDNQNMPITSVQELIQILVLIEDQHNEAFSHRAFRKELLNFAKTVEEVESI